ncbi:MAG: diaminopimelate decarboxylase [Deltaproteobacteria bacterium]|nr:diaminopimelate decarboxylase [Deltaproteobacteria bacterium]MBN2673927.1 diaminopimelate decarboxylase [Deltaproteobacteria bacterium]
MMKKKLPFTRSELEEIAGVYPTPFHIYDERAIRENIRIFLKAFEWADFKEYFAVKATPNPYLMKILKEEGCGMDCSSLPELLLAEKTGIVGEEIMFSSNETPASEFQAAQKLGAIINLDDITHIPYLEKHCGIPETISIRYNPGPERTGNSIIGNPVESKYGFTRPQVFEGLSLLRRKGASRFGIHCFVISNELNRASYVETAKMLFELVKEVKDELGISIAFVNLSGGIGIPYHPEQDAVDLFALGREIKKEYDELIVANGLHPLGIRSECGRMVTGPYGYLVTRAIHEKHIYKEYIGVDATMANLMRPGLYGAYHHISVPGKETAPLDCTYDVVGSLCENNDKFAVDRELPKIDMGDLLVIHDAGAHGHAMGFNYNGKLRSAELLLKEDGSVEQIRRAETIDDLFATLDFSKL